MRAVIALFLALAGIVVCGQADAQDAGSSYGFEFDAGAYEKKAFEWGGNVQFETQYLNLDRNSALYLLSDAEKKLPASNTIKSAALQLDGTYRKDAAQARVSLNGEKLTSDVAHDRTLSLYEGVLSYEPTAGTTLEVGKKVMKWGKGYAWNPVGFVERSKNPDDPEAAREGYVMASADIIKSFSEGPVQSVAFTPVVLPTASRVNAGFGQTDEVNVAAKLYALVWDTDVDVMALASGSKTGRVGADFSRNLTANFELHGEAAYINANTRTIVDPTTGAKTRVTNDAVNYLLGARYLTESEVTIIAEYFHQGGGVTQEELRDFFDLSLRAVTTANAGLIGKAVSAKNSGFGKSTPGRDYGYLKLSQKEPFDLLYFTPSLTLISNLADGSYSITPEAIYTGFDNTELRLRAGYLQGGDTAEYGAKQNDYKLELRLRYFF